ncbi:hypothetical protein [Flavobacterium sp. 7A]|uniref:hypothetical protein n=1 Tax=Flavobacterium sp. 7A TaxID=2940571 RepID=UPI002227F32B|nr:hypothetical protein [Flavobacterium sp. 7A]MCW2118856.1 hypothetical protein [Flavobacterium sp. 7A]
MMKYLSTALVVLLFSCGKEENIQLPKAAKTIVSDVQDHSPIYIFFRSKEKDTLAEVNRKNSIITTNWILNIDARLPLKLVIPEVMKLQEKKRQEKAHKNEKAENFYAYADTIGKNMAFIPFTKVFYKIGKPDKNKLVFHFRKGNDFIILNGVEVKKTDLITEFGKIKFEVMPDVVLQFDKNMSYAEYLQNKILIEDFKGTNEEYIF